MSTMFLPCGWQGRGTDEDFDAYSLYIKVLPSRFFLQDILL